MSNNLEEQAQRQTPRVEWRTAINIVSERHGTAGTVTREAVRRAIDGMVVVSGLIDIVVTGPVDLVSPDAGLELAFVLGTPTEIRVYAHGAGVPCLMDAIRVGLQEDAQFRAVLGQRMENQA